MSIESSRNVSFPLFHIFKKKIIQATTIYDAAGFKILSLSYQIKLIQ